MSKRKVTQATKAKLRKSSRLYQKVRKATANEMERRGTPLKGKDLTEFTKNVYGEFKGLSTKEVKVQDINDVIERVITGVAVISSGDFINPLNIPVQIVSGIFWFDLDNFIEVDLTAETGGKNLRFEVNAGEYGSTGIINLSDYQYEGSGVNQIIENVRDLIGDESEPYWEAEVRVRPNMMDDGNPDSYFLQFTLYVNGEQIIPTDTFEEAQLIEPSTETIEQRRERRREIVKRRKELAKQRREKVKRKEMRTRKRPTKKVVKEEPKPEKAPSKKEFDADRAANIQKALDRQERLLADAKALYDDGILTKQEFIAERKAIIKQTSDAIDKFKKGGLI